MQTKDQVRNDAVTTPINTAAIVLPPYHAVVVANFTAGIHPVTIRAEVLGRHRVVAFTPAELPTESFTIMAEPGWPSLEMLEIPHGSWQGGCDAEVEPRLLEFGDSPILGGIPRYKLAPGWANHVLHYTNAAEEFQRANGVTTDELFLLMICSEITAQAFVAMRAENREEDLPASFQQIHVASPILSPDRRSAMALRFW
jgi:hypothetical protein